MKTVKHVSKKKDVIAYDPHMLDGIEFIDMASAITYIKSMIPTSEYSRNSPYVRVRKLVKYFDKEKGVLRHGRGGSALVVKYLNSLDDVRKAIVNLTVKDGELLHLVYEQNVYVGTELIDRVRWKLDEIQTEVHNLIVGIENSECMARFSDKEAIKGSDDGRLVGLSELVANATESLYEINQNIIKLDDIMRKGKDPMEYSCVGSTKAKRKMNVR